MQHQPLACLEADNPLQHTIRVLHDCYTSWASFERNQKSPNSLHGIELATSAYSQSKPVVLTI
jgi:hypothetical protein